MRILFLFITVISLQSCNTSFSLGGGCRTTANYGLQSDKATVCIECDSIKFKSFRYLLHTYPNGFKWK